MRKTMVSGQLQNPFQVHKADSGAIRFEMICTGMLDTSLNPFIVLLAKECPHLDLYKITFEYDTGIISLQSTEERKLIELPDFLISLTTREFWLTWFNNEMCMGLKNQPPFLTHTINSEGKTIGFMKLKVTKNINWDVKCPPFLLPPLTYKHIEDGKLYWVKMVDNKLPPGAFIGGFENEPLYIARAMHNNSLCPGKYVPSKQCAYVPWGFREHEKRNFEVVGKFLSKHEFDLICRAHQVVEDGYEFFAKRQLVTLFSAPNYCGEFDNAGALMSVDETLMCSFQILKPADKRKLYSGLNMGRPNTPPRAQPKNKKN